MEKKLFSVVETGKILGISRTKVYELIKAGYLRAIDIGGQKVSGAEIDAFIAKYTGCSFKDIQCEDAPVSKAE